MMLRLIIAALLILPSGAALAQDAPEIVNPPGTNIVVPDGTVVTPTESAAEAVTSVTATPKQVSPSETAPPAEEIVAAVPPPAAPDLQMTPIEKEISDQLAYLKPTVDVNTMPSLFLTIWEHDLVRDARRGLVTRDPDSADDGVEIEMGPRDISLGGIVYASGKDWTIWLNNTRISPTRIPTEVLDLKVYKDYIELEWFDSGTNQIFPIRLRPHQRFNLDTRMFLPG